MAAIKYTGKLDRAAHAETMLVKLHTCNPHDYVVIPLPICWTTANVRHDMQGLQGQELYLTGGNDGTAWLDAVEVYTPSRGSWVTAEPMPLERGYGAAAAIGRQMFVMGGGNGSSWLQSVMMCNLETGHWVEVRFHLSRFCFGAVMCQAVQFRAQGPAGGKPEGYP